MITIELYSKQQMTNLARLWKVVVVV